MYMDQKLYKQIYSYESKKQYLYWEIHKLREILNAMWILLFYLLV